MVIPEMRYARSGECRIAYQVLGDGPFDLVWTPGALSHLELRWADEGVNRFYRALSSFSRLIVFDKRGTGLSDRVAGIADLETRMDDIRAVMDAAGSETAAVCGVSEGGPMAAALRRHLSRARAGARQLRLAAAVRPRAELSLGGAEARVPRRVRGGGGGLGKRGQRA